MDLQLYYGPLLVGDLTEVFEHQGTWFGTFRPAFSAPRGLLDGRICEFIAFCEEFNARAEAGQDHDAAEFDSFDDLLSSGLWRVIAPGGTVSEIKDAPNWLGGGTTCWITV
jgi:hypothetical protein